MLNNENNKKWNERRLQAGKNIALIGIAIRQYLNQYLL